jgi:hypothetical protein
MRSLLLVPVAVGLVLVAPRPARADGLYFTEAFGGAKIKNELGAHLDTAVNLHVGLGYRAGRTSFEAWMGGDIPTGDQGYDDYGYDYEREPSPMLYGLDVKRAFRLSTHLEVYLRGSMSRMQIDEGLLSGYSGRGLGVGTGIQLKGKAPLLMLLYPPIALVCLIPDVCKKLGPKATVALYYDQGYDFYRLHDPGRSSIDAEATRWRLGFAIGMDF